MDGLILVAAGAGGHAGEINSFAFVDSVRTFWDGIILLAGSISTGHSILAAQAAGADLAYMGTRFIVAKESRANDEYREMLVDSDHDDIILTDAFSGVNCNMLKPSIRKEGLDPEQLAKKKKSILTACPNRLNLKRGVIFGQRVMVWGLLKNRYRCRHHKTIRKRVSGVLGEIDRAGGKIKRNYIEMI